MNNSQNIPTHNGDRLKERISICNIPGLMLHVLSSIKKIN